MSDAATSAVGAHESPVSLAVAMSHISSVCDHAIRESFYAFAAATLDAAAIASALLHR
jgi:hypothetical protein